MDELQLERLGGLVDTADNFLEYETMPVSSKMAMGALLHGLKQVRAEIKELYLELGGEDVWDR